jgi:tetratricopeptide (TPR) repeat protein
VSASEQAAWFMAEAARAYGSRVLAAPGDAGTSGPEALGRNLLRLIFGAGAADRGTPAPLSALIASPDSSEALTALEAHVEEAVEADPGLTAKLSEMLAGFYREQFESSDGQVLADLGGLLWWDDPQQARAAFERAVEAGNQHALIDLAKLRDAVLHDGDAALRTYQQAAEFADPDVAVEALVELGHMHAIYREAPAAQAAYQQAIGTRHPRWAPQAMIGLGNLLLRQPGDDDGAQAMFQQAIESADPDSRACAFVRLATLLKRRGDVTGAKAAWRQAIDSREAPWAEIALSDLLNQLEAEGNLDGARAAHSVGVGTANPDAPHALVIIGNLLKERGDTEGWRAAWQQAIDTGYPAADDLREILSPPAEDEDDPGDDAEPVDLPPEFDPRNMAQTGIAVLGQGLPPLPDVLTYQMAIPVAYWTASQCAVVIFLRFSRHGRERWPLAIMATFSRDQGRWKADSHWHGTGWNHDPIANPGDLRELDGQAMVVGGGSRTDTPAPGHPAIIQLGRAAPTVRQIALLQDGHEDRRPLDSHFGFWVVCTEQPSPFHVTALDQNGTVLADITY